MGVIKKMHFVKICQFGQKNIKDNLTSRNTIIDFKIDRMPKHRKQNPNSLAFVSLNYLGFVVLKRIGKSEHVT